MSKKKARLILCSNINFNQYFNLYLHKKPLINKFTKKKETLLYNKLDSEITNCESLQYSILQSCSLYSNNYTNIYKINNVLSIYLKKYYTSLLHYNNITLSIKKNVCYYNNLYFNFYTNILNKNFKKPLLYIYKNTSRYYNTKNNVTYNEIQNENKLLTRKVNIYKYKKLIQKD